MVSVSFKMSSGIQREVLPGLTDISSANIQLGMPAAGCHKGA
jgi:hypothetical protein